MTGVVALGLWASGCDGNPTTVGPTDQARAATVPADKTVKPPPTRGRMLGGQSVVRVVDWSSPGTVDASAYETLPESAQREVDMAPVPMLVPNDAALLASAVVTTGKHWAALASHADGIHVSVQASGEAKVYSHIKPVRGPDQVRGQDAFVTHNEGIWVASWIEHGVAYNVELECADIKADACQNEQAVTAVAEGLTFVGGRGEAHR
ncbi:MAG: hypothetical protein AAF721_10460 [Myxococcota bacterium]